MTKHKLALRSLAIFLLLLVGCTQDDSLIPLEDNVSEKEEIFKTVSTSAALDLFQSNSDLIVSSTEGASSDQPFAVPNLDLIHHEALINTDALVTVIPATTEHDNVSSRILLLSVNDEIQTIVFNMIPGTDNTSDGFTGRYIITDLDGNFIIGYKVNNRLVVSIYRLKSNTGETNTTSSIDVSHNITSSIGGSGTCIGITCGEDLEEVIVNASDGNNQVSFFYIPWPDLIPSGGGSGFNYDPSGSGGSGSAGGGGDPSIDPLTQNCPPGQDFDYFLERCVRQCNFGFQDFGNGVCVRVDCDTKKEDLKDTFTNGNDADLDKLAEVINKFGKDFGINTKEKLQHFLAQAGHESGGFRNLGITESLHYTTNSRLTSIFFPYFSETDTINKRKPDDYLRNSSEVANYVYANRLGNGDEASGDGFKYRGRGIFQLTGKSNYQQFQTFYNNRFSTNINIINSPSTLTSNKELSIISALWFFQKNVLNKLTVDSSVSVKKITRKVNGGTNGLTDRINKHNDTKNHIDCI